MSIAESQIKPNDAVLIVDIQNDFCPGGALPVPDGDTIIPECNRWIQAAERANVPVFYSQDHHPKRHPSFASEGGPWPEHCVAGSYGAKAHQDLSIPPDAVVVYKGTRFDTDQYSMFKETGFAALLRKDRIERVWIGGLALEYCVKETALHAINEGFTVRLIPQGSKAITEEGGSLALEEMAAAGIRISA